MGRIVRSQDSAPEQQEEMGKHIPGTPNPMPTVIRTVPDEGKKAITVNVPQGIGDIFWVYQKLAPYFDLIHFKILVTRNDLVQERAAKWLDVLPKTGSIIVDCVSHHRYSSIIAKHYSMADVMAAYESGRREIDYACNLPLEEGKNLYQIDPDYPIESTVAIQTVECPVVYDNYIAAYVSGGTKELGAIREGCWSVNRWCEFFMRFDKIFKPGLPYLFVGASYDKDVIASISAHIGRYGITSGYYIDSYPANVTYILKKAKFFIGYQSGLNIIADNLGTSQYMVYFHKLLPMMYTWCKPGHPNTKFFADTFKSSPYEAICRLKASNFTVPI